MVIDKTSRRGTEWAEQERREPIRTEGGRQRSGPPLLWGGGDPPLSESRGGEGEVSGWAGAGVVGGTWRGEVRATVWSELSAVGQLSAPLSSPRSVSDTIYLAVKPQQPSRSPRSPLIHPRGS